MCVFGTLKFRCRLLVFYFALVVGNCNGNGGGGMVKKKSCYYRRRWMENERLISCQVFQVGWWCWWWWFLLADKKFLKSGNHNHCISHHPIYLLRRRYGVGFMFLFFQPLHSCPSWLKAERYSVVKSPSLAPGVSHTNSDWIDSNLIKTQFVAVLFLHCNNMLPEFVTSSQTWVAPDTTHTHTH